ncbi:MAG: hypothetical protein IJZ80_06515 [Clostridia bacterium]|nr:hypothetical protein [Clostridia bacterium]
MAVPFFRCFSPIIIAHPIDLKLPKKHTNIAQNKPISAKKSEFQTFLFPAALSKKVFVQNTHKPLFFGNPRHCFTLRGKNAVLFGRFWAYTFA